MSITGGQYLSAKTSDANFSSSQQQIIDRIKPKRIIYLGEIHDSEIDRQAKLAIVRSLHGKGAKLAIGMEIFQRPFQGALDRYVAGQISESQLLLQTEYAKRWGFDWKYYADIVRFAKDNRLPIIALNTPTEVTRKVAKQGIESLTAAERQYIPPVAQLDRSNLAYRDRIFASYQQHKATAQLNSKTFDRFYTSQLLWDETMAEATANFAIANPTYQTIVIAGQAHIAYGEGIPNRVLRRLKDRPKFTSFSQATILLSADKNTANLQPKPADYIWAAVEE
jgi:uncharacterized iron-regulated protein